MIKIFKGETHLFLCVYVNILQYLTCFNKKLHLMRQIRIQHPSMNENMLNVNHFFL